MQWLGTHRFILRVFLLFSVLWKFCNAAVLVHCQGRMKTRMHHVSVCLSLLSFVHIVISMCPPLCLHVQACVHGASVYVHFLLRFSVYLYLCVCFHATGRGGLVSLSIDKAARLRLLMGWCDKDSLPRSVCVLCVRVCVSCPCIAAGSMRV